MVHTVIEVMRMDKKFIAAVAVCFVALVGVATGTYFLGQKSDENIVKLGKANITETTAADKNIEAAGNVVEKETQKETAMESETPKDREVEPGGYLTEETTKEKVVNNVVEENTQSNVSKKDYMYGLSSEAAAQTIAYVNQPTKYYSKEGDNIYFSVERNGKTKDPLNYIDYED